MTQKPLKNDDIERALAPVSPSRQKKREARVKRDFWKVIKRAGRVIPFMDDLVASYYCALDPKTPSAARATIFAALAYFVAPIDLVPDFIIMIGFGDDMAILAAVIATLRANITDEHRAKAEIALADHEDEPENDRA